METSKSNLIQHVITPLMLLALLSSCTDPDLDRGRELGQACVVQDDCAPELNCDSTLRQCAPTYQNRNGVFSDYLVIGINAPLSGDLQTLGEDASTGINAYFSHINTTEGGIHGRQLRLALYDNKGQDTVAAQNAQTMTNPQERPIFVSLGNLGTSNLSSQLSLHQERRVVILGPVTGAESARTTPSTRHVFTLGVGDTRSSTQLTNHLLEAQGVTPENLGVLAPAPSLQDTQPWSNLSPESQEGFRGVNEVLGTSRGIPIDQWFPSSLPSSASTSLQPALDRTISWILSPQRKRSTTQNTQITLLLLGDISQNARFITALDQRLSTPPDTLTEEQRTQLENSTISYAVHSTGALGLLEKIDSCQKVTAALPIPPSDASTQASKDYILHLSRSSERAPSLVGFHTYLSARTLVQALRNSGPYLSDDALIESLQSLGDFSLGLDATTRLNASNHQTLRDLWIAKGNDTCSFAQPIQVNSP